MKERYLFHVEEYKKEMIGIISILLETDKITPKFIESTLKKFPKDKNKIFSRDNIISGINFLLKLDIAERRNLGITNHEDELRLLISTIRMKPTRSISGVTTVTVLTKPFACPGQCIFCPNDVRMPKSYITSEPGAQRAFMNRFSPYAQVFNRLNALRSIGHPTEKIELLVLGGTWSYYTKSYKVWFIHECFRAMNDFGDLISGVKEISLEDKESLKSINIEEDLKIDFNDKLREMVGDKPYNQLIQTNEYKEYIKNKICEEKKVSWEELEEQQIFNQTGKTRCVGLVLETRPDTIDQKEVYELRKLGATKIQLGVQTLDDEISKLNKRGETKLDTSNAFKLLRAGGFKIHAHMMPNLYEATPEIDLRVYNELFNSPEYKPDEVKIYPTSLIKNTELFERYTEGKYTPYDNKELTDLLSNLIELTPEYCRLTRIIRDIPSQEIVNGNKVTNLREDVETKLLKEGRKNSNIRAREVKDKILTLEDLTMDIIKYDCMGSIEYFLQYITKKREIAGFLRLSIPMNRINEISSELNDSTIIREVHIYGPSLELNKLSTGEAQHLGLGSKLIEKAKEITRTHNFPNIAVISSIGTREYYSKRGFNLIDLYQVCKLD